MDITVDYDKLEELGEDVIRQNEDLNKDFQDLIKIIDELSTGWNGLDYESFKSISTTYIKKLENITNEIEYLGKFIISSATTYSINDCYWEDSIKKIEVDKNEFRKKYYYK